MTTLQTHLPHFQLQPYRLIFVNRTETLDAIPEPVGGIDNIYTGVIREEFDEYLADNPDTRMFFEREDRALLSIPSTDVVFRSVCSKVAEQIREMVSLGEVVTLNYVRAFARIITDSKCKIAKLKVDSQLDFLTDLPDRRAFHKRLEEEIRRSGRSKTPLCMLIFDLDKFKEVNDHGGHPAGDAALEFIGECFRDTGEERILRDTDFAARVGGDELYLLLPDTDAEGAIIAAKRIQDAVSAKEFVYGNDASPQTFRLSSSIGIAHYEGSDLDSDGSKMISTADNCLYVMKGMRRDANGVQLERRGNIAYEGRIIPSEEIDWLIEKKQGAKVIPISEGDAIDVAG